ncbi:MAG: hypothetical protein V1800_04955 [Candidatus Latescibacterota bacterium]
MGAFTRSEDFLRGTLREDPFGMMVESVAREGDRMVVQTTGAVFEIDCARGQVRISQRIGKERPVATLHAAPMDGKTPFQSLRVEEQTPGSVVLGNPDQRGIIQINGDSLFSLSCASEEWMTLRTEFSPAFCSHADGHSMYMDDLGGITVHPWRDRGLPTAFPPKPQGVSSTENGRFVDVVRIEPGEELWLSVAPAREFDWQESFKSIYWHRGDGTEFWTEGDQALPWTPETAWPDDEAFLRGIAKDYDVLHLQAECALWQNWNLGYMPRFPDRAKRCLETAHHLGLKVVVYASPFYFYAGTEFESRDFSVPEWSRDWWRCGNYHGDNWERYVEAIRRLLAGYDVDGIYFDGSFLLNLPNTYKMTRRIRSLLGPERILYSHCTWSPPAYSKVLSCPAVNTYCDFLLRGEESAELYTDESHLRYCISDYRMGNSVSLLCNSGTKQSVTKDWIDRLIAANLRLPYDPGVGTEVWRYYLEKLRTLGEVKSPSWPA